MQAVALDMVEVMVRSSSPPLGEPLINVAFPAVVQRTLNTDDNSTLQNGGECLRAYVSVAPDQVMYYGGYWLSPHAYLCAVLQMTKDFDAFTT